MTRTFTESKAFTLIELLVVIAIIGILAGMLSPVLVSARKRAQRVECGGNLSQFGKAVVMYALENAEAYPTNLVSLVDEGYLDNVRIFTCRSDDWRDTPKRESDLTAALADTHCSYSLFTKQTNGVPMSATVRSTTMLMCDKDGEHGNADAKHFGGNHDDKGGNVLFADGSVRWVRAKAWNADTWQEADPDSAIGY